MSTTERLSDFDVSEYANNGTPVVQALAREVQWWRNDDALGVTAVFDLMNRHGITVEGIVALVDEVMDATEEDERATVLSLYALRRLARGEEA